LTENQNRPVYRIERAESGIVGNDAFRRNSKAHEGDLHGTGLVIAFGGIVPGNKETIDPPFPVEFRGGAHPRGKERVFLTGSEVLRGSEHEADRIFRNLQNRDVRFLKRRDFREQIGDGENGDEQRENEPHLPKEALAPFDKGADVLANTRLILLGCGFQWAASMGF
jgi:hypothetical protein